MNNFAEIKIKCLEDHINDQDKTIQGWIVVADTKDKIIEQYKEIVKKLNQEIDKY